MRTARRRGGVAVTCAVVLGITTVVTLGSPNRADAADQCTGGTRHTVDRAEAQPADGVTGCMYPTGFESTSPSIQVSSDGTLFIAKAVDGILRSTDGGLSWKEVRVPKLKNGDSHATGVHGYVHLDPRTDRVWYVTSMAAASCGGASGSVISWSDDHGDTWRGTTLGCDTFDWGKVLTGPAPPGSSYPSAVYFFGVGLRPVGGQRFVHRSLDGGATWQRMANSAAVTTEGGVGAAAPDGTIYFDYPEFIGFDPTRVLDATYPFKPENLCRQMVAVSEDYGVTWRQEPVPGSMACLLGSGSQRLAVDQAGTLYVLWVDDITVQVLMSTSKDHARTWTTPVNVMPPGAAYGSAHADIVAAEPGHVLIASLMTRSPLTPKITLAYQLGDYYAYMSESFDADGATPHFDTVSLDREGPFVRPLESSNEASAYLGMSPGGEGWAVFTRHAANTGDDAEIVATRIQRRPAAVAPGAVDAPAPRAPTTTSRGRDGQATPSAGSPGADAESTHATDRLPLTGGNLSALPVGIALVALGLAYALLAQHRRRRPTR